tara:strand:+ start:353 stop:514 length:162 start_codon:yes stop_codon:yes gene_type:complete
MKKSITMDVPQYEMLVFISKKHNYFTVDKFVSDFAMKTFEEMQKNPFKRVIKK